MQIMLSLFFSFWQPLFSIISAVPDAAEANTKQARKQAIQQQQNTQALMQVSDKTRSILSLLANGFSRPSGASSGFNYVRGAASSLAASAGVNSSPLNPSANLDLDPSSTAKSPNPEMVNPGLILSSSINNLNLNLNH